MQSTFQAQIAAATQELADRGAPQLMRELVELRQKQANHRAQIQRSETELAEAYQAIADEKQKRRPPAEQMRDLRAAQADLNQREDEFNRRVEEFEAKGRRSRRHRGDDDAFELRAAAIRELAKLLAPAKKQAAKGKPALLRMILRASR